MTITELQTEGAAIGTIAVETQLFFVQPPRRPPAEARSAADDALLPRAVKAGRHAPGAARLERARSLLSPPERRWVWRDPPVDVVSAAEPHGEPVWVALRSNAERPRSPSVRVTFRRIRPWRSWARAYLPPPPPPPPPRRGEARGRADDNRSDRRPNPAPR